MIKKTFINILAISLISILLFPIIGTAHRTGEDNPPEEVHKVIEVLFGLDSEEVHDEVKHDFNNYGAKRWFAATPCDGYEGGHSGYDVIHDDDDAPFYSLTDGVVLKVKHPNPDNIKVLSYIAVYNEEHKKTILYLHPSVIDVKEEEKVWIGKLLGEQGNTGFSTNPHVHLEIRSGEWGNPSCGVTPILPKHRHHRNEPPIPFLYEQVMDFDNDGPDLVIESVEPESITLEPGEEFRLYSTLKNQGTVASEPTKLQYYFSTNDIISPNDEQIGGNYSRPRLRPNQTFLRFLPITAPKTSGTYYYGVCVDSVDDEINTDNNCSEAIKVIVRSSDADVNKDGIVDVQDLVQVAQQYGQEGNNAADVNGDGVVDIEDLILVAEAIDDAADAPAVRSQVQALFTAEQLQELLTAAKALENISLSHQKGVALLEQFFRLSMPKKNALLPNYPNPFNPETWIPYQLSEDTLVSVSIYDTTGELVRTLSLGFQSAGFYNSRGRAAYWDGRNELGEPVASGVYFYTLTAGDFSATRKMLIRK